MFTKVKRRAESNGDISLISSAGNEHIIIADNADREDLNGVVVDVNDEYEHGTQGSTNAVDSKHIWMQLFHSIVLLTYALIIGISCFNTSNAYHVFCWITTFCSVSCHFVVIRALLFSTQLCHHTMEYRFMNGVSYNYIPHKINIHLDKPFDSLSHLSHIRGSHIHKCHTVLAMFCAFPMLSCALTKMFQFEADTPTQQRVAVYCLLCAAIGGLISANNEVYVSPSFSRKVNFCSDVLHTCGAFCFLIIGNLAFAMYNGFHWIGNVLLASSVFIISLYFVVRTIREYLHSVDDKHEQWVHSMSQINIGLEVASFIPCNIAWSALMYQFGNE